MITSQLYSQSISNNGTKSHHKNNYNRRTPSHDDTVTGTFQSMKQSTTIKLIYQHLFEFVNYSFSYHDSLRIENKKSDTRTQSTTTKSPFPSEFRFTTNYVSHKTIKVCSSLIIPFVSLTFVIITQELTFINNKFKKIFSKSCYIYYMSQTSVSTSCSLKPVRTSSLMGFIFLVKFYYFSPTLYIYTHTHLYESKTKKLI